MACGNNQPAWTAKEEEKGEDSITGKPSVSDGGGLTPGAFGFEADIMSAPFNSLGYSHFSGPDIRREFHSYPPDLNCFPDSKIDENLISVKSEISDLCRESEMSIPDMSMSGLSYEIGRSNFVSANRVTSMDYGKLEVPMNFMPPRCEACTGYPLKAHGAEAKINTISSYHMSGKFSSSECRTSLLPLVCSFDASGNKNEINDIPPSFSSPHKEVDGNFLKLGIGSGTDIRPNSNFSAQEIAGKLEEVSSNCSNSFVRDLAIDSLNLTHSTGRDGMIRTSGGGLLSSACSLASRMSTGDEGGLIGDMGFRLNSSQQANTQSNFSATCFSSEFDSSLLSLPFGSTSISTPQCGTETDYRRESSMKVSSESFKNHFSQGHNQSSFSHAQLGRLSQLTGGTQTSTNVHFPDSVQPARNVTLTAKSTRRAAAKIGPFASSVHKFGHLDTHNVRPVGALGNSLFPEINGSPISKGGTFQSAAASPFPKRLGLQPNDIAIAQSPRGPAQLSAPLNPYRTPASAGQYQHGMPVQLSKDFPRVDYSTGQVIPVAKFDAKPQAPIVSHPSLKRKATENPPTTRSCQQRKMLPHLSSPGPRQIIQTNPALIPATLHIPLAPVQRPPIIQTTPPPIPKTVHIPPTRLHIKWKGFDDERLEPSGEKCLLCRRDLSFTAEGQVFLPAAPPPIAVLPCGHTFHDQCLQIITPEDQSNSPPCIPCAVGET